MGTFLAIDFETATTERTSACSIAIVKVVDNRIVDRIQHLIRPPEPHFQFTYIHGITWEDVEDEPTFGELWPQLEPEFKGIDFVTAHNAPFDRGVLNACCELAGIHVPRKRFVCTVKLARKTWSIFPTKLPDVCDFLDLKLDHHQALSDAEACANIVIAAAKTGAKI